MKLGEYTETLNNIYVKLGANKGSGFIYCGTADQFGEFAKNFDVEYMAKLENSLAVQEANLRTIRPRWKRHIKGRMSSFIEKHKDDKNLQSKLYKIARKGFRSKKKERCKLKKTIENYKNKIAEYKPIAGREVLISYMSILENEDGYKDLIVIYEGKENAPAWDLTEYRKAEKVED